MKCIYPGIASKSQDICRCLSEINILIYFIINTIFTYLPTNISVHWQSIIMGLLVLISVGVQSEVLHNIKIGKKKVEA